MKNIFPIASIAILFFCSCNSTQQNPVNPPVDSTAISIDTAKAPTDAFLHNVPADSKKIREEYYDITVDSKGNPEPIKTETAYLGIYDRNGNLLEEGYYSADSSVYQKWIFQFDSKGLKTGSSEYHKKGELAFKGFFTYDNQNNFNQGNYYLPDGKLSYTITNKYDHQRNKTENEVNLLIPAAGCKAKGKSVDTFDAKHHVLSHTYYGSDGNLASIHNYKYDEKGNCVEDNFVDPDNNTTTTSYYKYEFDAKGNWIKKTEYKKYDEVEKSLHAIVRTIEYY